MQPQETNKLEDCTAHAATVKQSPERKAMGDRPIGQLILDAYVLGFLASEAKPEWSSAASYRHCGAFANRQMKDLRDIFAVLDRAQPTPAPSEVSQEAASPSPQLIAELTGAKIVLCEHGSTIAAGAVDRAIAILSASEPLHPRVAEQLEILERERDEYVAAAQLFAIEKAELRRECDRLRRLLVDEVARDKRTDPTQPLVIKSDPDTRCDDPWKCPNFKEIESSSMQYEYYACEVCGKRDKLDYEEMR